MIPQIKPEYGQEEAQAIYDYCMSGGWGTENHKTKAFEEKLAKRLGVKYVSMTTSGTQALYLSLIALGVGRGDKVMVPAVSMIATLNAVLAVGANPIFCDINDLGCLDFEDFTKKIDSSFKCVIYVSLNGRAIDLHKIILEAYKRNIAVLEDSCQSLGSKHSGISLGTMGEIGCFSLSPHKIISTGQGGFIATNSQEHYDNFKRLKNFGRLEGGSDYHEHFGLNGKFTDFQAVIGTTQLQRLERRIQDKKRIFGWYYDRLSDYIDMIPIDEGNVPWFVDIYVDDRQKYSAKLLEAGIQTRPMYPPMYKQPFVNKNINLPNAERFHKRGLWLPSSPNLNEYEVDWICRTILSL